ncbi:MAG: hypothetical protein H3C34_18845, partial [Caldilineaceae bacterium]|nr:hypothetical protein [Caldilineaceae bacterium]
QSRNPNAPSTQILEIFKLMQQGEALASALELPPLEDILSLDPTLRDTMLPELYRQANTLLAMVSKAYLADEGAYVRAYNKTKHGFVVVDDPNLFGDNPSASEDDKAWIIADNPAFRQLNPPSDEAPIELYDVSLAHVDPMVDQIETIRGAVEVLCQLVIYLLEQDAISATFHQHG